MFSAKAHSHFTGNVLTRIETLKIIIFLLLGLSGRFSRFSPFRLYDFSPIFFRNVLRNRDLKHAVEMAGQLARAVQHAS